MWGACLQWRRKDRESSRCSRLVKRRKSRKELKKMTFRGEQDTTIGVRGAWDGYYSVGRWSDRLRGDIRSFYYPSLFLHSTIINMLQTKCIFGQLPNSTSAYLLAPSANTRCIRIYISCLQSGPIWMNAQGRCLQNHETSLKPGVSKKNQNSDGIRHPI